MKPILSISMLCSGREETRKCLDSLKPIMEQVSSELIIVDTGCDEATREMLAEYTDHIIPFTWCDDFAKARNTGLKAAKGEWFLYIDDDEYFGDVQDLVEFFRTGEYKKYGQACYIQRNYKDRSGQRYQDMWVSRMAKINPDIHFRDRIHEYLWPVYGENRLINSWVDHYGYVYDTPEMKRNHDLRNIKLLEDAVREEPENLRIRIHLAQEYFGIPEFLKMADLCQESIQMLSKENDNYSNSYRDSFYVGKILALLNLGEFQEAEEFFEKAARDKRNSALGRAGLNMFASEIYYRKDEYAACDKCCEEYIKVYNAMGGKIVDIPLSPVFVQDIFYRSNRNNVLCIYMCSKLAQQDTKTLKEYFWELGWEEENFGIYSPLFPAIVRAMASLPYEEEFSSIAQKLIEDERVRDLTIAELQKQIKEKGDDVLYPLARIFGQVESEHYYIWYLRLFHAAKENQEEELKEAYCKLFRKVADVLELEDRIFAIAGEHGLDMNEVLAGVPYDQWARGVNTFCEKNPLNMILVKKAFMDRYHLEGTIRYDYFDLKVAEVEAVVTVADIDHNVISRQLQKFSDKSLAFYQRFFRPEAFEGEMEMLPASCRVAVKLQDVLKAQEAGDITAFREALTGCIGVFGPMNKGLQNYGKLYAEWRQAQLQKEDQSANEEMQILARQVKQQLRKIIVAGDKQAARDILKQLKSLVPNDPDLPELEVRCRE